MDPWLTLIAGISEKIVFDLESESDEEEISKFYGDRTKWKEFDRNKTIL